MKKLKFAIGPHHGEHDIPTTYINLQNFCLHDEGRKISKKLKLGDNYLDNMEKVEPFLEQSLKDVTKGYKMLNNQLDTWGTYSLITLKVEDGDSVHMTDWRLSQWLAQFQGACITAFLMASGDDDTFDYVPSFIEAFEQTIEILGKEGIIIEPEDKLKNFRHSLYLLDPEFPEFFTDEECEEWTK